MNASRKKAGMTDHEWEVVHTMGLHGVGFIKALAEAWYRADRANFTKLMLAFPEYWKQYEEMAEQIKKNKEQVCQNKKT